MAPRAAEVEERKRGYTIYTAAEFETAEFTAPRFLDGGQFIRAPGKHLIWGDPGSYKTWWTLDRDVEVAASGARVFVALGEGEPYTVRERLRGICRARGLYLSDLQDRLVVTFDTEWIDGAAGRTFIRQVILPTRPQLVMFDPLISYYAGDENSSADVKRFLRILDEELFKRGVSIAIVHHGRKTGKDTPSSPRGSSAFHGWTDVEMEFRALEGMESVFQLETTKRRDGVRNAVVSYRWQQSKEAGTYALVELPTSFGAPAPAEAKPDRRRRRNVALPDVDLASAVRRAKELILGAGPAGYGRRQLLDDLGVVAGSPASQRFEEQLFVDPTVKLLNQVWRPAEST